MKEFVVTQNDAGQRLDKFVEKAIPLLSPSLRYKYIRIKRIKVNGKRAEASVKLAFGDVISAYVNDELVEKPDEDTAYLSISPKINILYEDKNLLLLDKRPGVVVHSDTSEEINTLITHIKAYLFRSGQWNPHEENSFTPALCNRIDRNTGGIVIAAKNAASLRVLNEKIKNREIDKYYLCVVHGRPVPSSGRLTGYIKKISSENRVVLSARPVKDAKNAVTEYRVIKSSEKLSLLECRLLTGRTHQIRAQLAAAGHPILGDGKYGANQDARIYKLSHQALYACRLVFSFKTPSGILSYLGGKSFEVNNVWFKDRFLSGDTNYRYYEN